MQDHTQRVMVNVSVFRCRSVTSDVPQGSVLAPVYFIIFTGSGIACNLSKFADDTKLCGADKMSDRQDVIQRDLDKLKHQAQETLMRFHKSKCRNLHSQWMLGDLRTEHNPAEKNFGYLWMTSWM